MFSANSRKYLVGLALGLGTSMIIFFILRHWGLFERMELLLLNLRSDIRYAREADTVLSENVRMQSQHTGKSADIFVIKMDNESFGKFGQMPWKRSTYARPLERFSRGQLTVTLTWNAAATPGFDRYSVYQSETPIKTPEDLARASLARTIKSRDEQVFADVLIVKPGRWYFAVTGISTNGQENMAVKPGANATEFPVEIVIKPALAADAQQWDKQYQLEMIRTPSTGMLTNPSAVIAQGLAATKNYPEAVFFDVFMLDEKDKDDDAKLYDAIAKNSGVYVDYMLHSDQQPPLSENERRVQGLQRFTIAATGTYKNDSVLYSPGYLLPVPTVVENVDGAGFANAKVDPDDMIRSWRMIAQFETDKYPNRFYPSAPLVLAMKYFRVPPEKVRVELGKKITLLDAEFRIRDASGRVVKIERRDYDIPIDDQGVLDIHYVGRPGTFVEYDDQLSSFTSFEKYAPSSLAGKIYMVGLYEQAVQSKDKITDYWPTPAGQMFGIEVMANTLNTILTGSYLTRASSAANGVVVILIGLILGLLLPRLSILKGAIFAIVLTLGFVVAAYFLYTENILINMNMPLFAIFLTFLGTSVYKTVTEESEKKFIRTQFGKFVNKNVVDELLRDPSKLRLGGERRDLTVLFSDIRSFTTLSEGMQAEELVSHLNIYLSSMTDIVMKYDGTLDKYVGDEIMAFWGAPLAQPDHAWLACAAAVDMMVALDDLNTRWPPERQLHIGVGINTGEMLVGQIGSESRMDYTVIGDNVNLGARLEGTNKVYGTGIIISEMTLTAVRDRVIVRELDQVRVKGKNKPVTIYELVDVIRA